MGEIIFRTPCTFHENCDETSRRILHRSSKEGERKETEKECVVCDGVLLNMRKTIKISNRWKCPVCGFEHQLKDGKLDPPLSVWEEVLSIVAS